LEGGLIGRAVPSPMLGFTQIGLIYLRRRRPEREFTRPRRVSTTIVGTREEGGEPSWKMSVLEKTIWGFVSRKRENPRYKRSLGKVLPPLHGSLRMFF